MHNNDAIVKGHLIFFRFLFDLRR